MIVQLFGVETIPAVFMFDAKHMKKTTVDITTIKTEEDLILALNDGLVDLKAKAASAQQVLN